MSLFFDNWRLAGAIKNKALDFAADAWAALKGEATPSNKVQIKDELDASMKQAGASVQERAKAQAELNRLFQTQGAERASERASFTLTTVALVLGITVAVIVISSKLKAI